MKYPTFEDCLEYVCFAEHPHVANEDKIEFFENWLLGLDVSEVIAHAHGWMAQTKLDIKQEVTK